MRSEGFPFIVWGSGGWTLVRLECLVGSASRRRRVVNSVSMGEAAKPLLFKGFQAGCHVVLRGRRGTLWHSNLFDNVPKGSKLEDVSHEMLVLLRPRVSSRVSGFLDASPCLWGKLQNLSFSKVSKQVVMSFCVAGVALCDIPTCFIRCRNFFCVAGATMHSTLYTLHFTLHTLHSTLYTPHSTHYTPHSTRAPGCHLRA